MNLYFITGNVNKFNEVKAHIKDIKQLDIELPEIQDIDAQKIITAKLHEAFKHQKGQFIVEDTSLYLNCLNGLPGPLIKWFLKTVGNEGLYNIAKHLKNNAAVAKTIIGYAKDKDTIHFFEGEIKGLIVSPQGDSGFGWNNIFKPDGYDKTFGELAQEEKDRISMRALAAIRLKEFLSKV